MIEIEQSIHPDRNFEAGTKVLCKLVNFGLSFAELQKPCGWPMPRERNTSHVHSYTGEFFSREV
jgi:hypothetical protein